MKNLSEQFIDRLKKLAVKRTWQDVMEADAAKGEPSYIDDFAGGNIDDAFYGGERYGETSTARAVLLELGIEFTVEE